jgi:bifunctional DNA-binding transcriptional regulator/antitoxin component of YhaV-PrlF toxin-antitoxin module
MGDDDAAITQSLKIQENGPNGGKLTFPAEMLEKSDLEVGDRVLFRGDPEENAARLRRAVDVEI